MSMVKKALLAILSTAVLSLPLSGAIRLGGSDLMRSVLAELDAGLEGVDISLEGSIRAWNDLQAGELDAAIIAFPSDQPPTGEWTSSPIAYQVVSVVVHETNPLEEISYPDLVSIFQEGGPIEEWGGVVDNPGWSTRKISTGAIRDRDSLALEIFASKVMQGAQMRTTNLYSEDPGDLLDAIVEDSNFIAILPDVVSAPLVKTLAVKQGPANQSYTPSADNVMFGDYPLRLAFYLVMPSDLDADTASALREIAYSDAMARALESHEYLPLPENERANYLNQ